MRATRDHECQIEDCDRPARWWVRSEFEKKPRNKHVCEKCRDEMLALYGWELTKGWN